MQNFSKIFQKAARCGACKADKQEVYDKKCI